MYVSFFIIQQITVYFCKISVIYHSKTGMFGPDVDIFVFLQ